MVKAPSRPGRYYSHGKEKLRPIRKKKKKINRGIGERPQSALGKGGGTVKWERGRNRIVAAKKANQRPGGQENRQKTGKGKRRKDLEKTSGTEEKENSAPTPPDKDPYTEEKPADKSQNPQQN